MSLPGAVARPPSLVLRHQMPSSPLTWTPTWAAPCACWTIRWGQRARQCIVRRVGAGGAQYMGWFDMIPVGIRPYVNHAILQDLHCSSFIATPPVATPPPACRLLVAGPLPAEAAVPVRPLGSRRRSVPGPPRSTGHPAPLTAAGTAAAAQQQRQHQQLRQPVFHPRQQLRVW
jgi:hypothetical protein